MKIILNSPFLVFSLTRSLVKQTKDAPKLIPLSALDRYQEGAELKLFCSASAPPSGGRLQLEWRKNNAQQLAPVEVNGSGSGGNSHGASSRGGTSRNLHISMMDDSSSVLRISNLEAEDSGNYTCLARNQFGFDSSTVRVNVNGKFHYLSSLVLSRLGCVSTQTRWVLFHPANNNRNTTTRLDTQHSGAKMNRIRVHVTLHLNGTRSVINLYHFSC